MSHYERRSWPSLCMGISAFVFVMFEVTKMILASVQIRRYAGAAASSSDPLERFKELEKANQRTQLLFGRYWVFTLLVTVPLAGVAVALLLWDFTAILIGGAIRVPGGPV